MMERESGGERDLRDVMDSPEGTEDDVRAGRSLSDFAPELAKNVSRAIERSARSEDRSQDRPVIERRDDRRA